MEPPPPSPPAYRDKGKSTAVHHPTANGINGINGTTTINGATMTPRHPRPSKVNRPPAMVAIKADEPGEASGSRTPRLPTPNGADAITPALNCELDHLARTAVQYDQRFHNDDDHIEDQNRIPDEQQQKRGSFMKFGSRREGKEKGVERGQGEGHVEVVVVGGWQGGRGGLRKKFKHFGERLKRLCRGRRRGVDKGKGKEMNDSVVVDPPNVLQEGGKYRGSDMVHHRPGQRVVPAGSSGVRSGWLAQPHAHPLPPHHPQLPQKVRTMPPPNEIIHPALRPRPGEPTGFFNNPHPYPHKHHPLATVQESSALPSSSFAPIHHSINNHNHNHNHIPRHPSGSPFLPHHHYPPIPHHQQVIITSPHPIADTYTHEEDWSHVLAAKAKAASQQTMYTTQTHTPIAMTRPLPIPERHSSRRWGARSFISGSFKSRSRSQCGSLDSRTSWNPFDLPGPPKKTLMSDMESLLQGRRGWGAGGSRDDGSYTAATAASGSSTPAGVMGVGGKGSQGSMAASIVNNNDNNNNRNLATMQMQFLWPPAATTVAKAASPAVVNNSVKTNNAIPRPDSAVRGLKVDKDGFMMPGKPQPHPQSQPQLTTAMTTTTTAAAAAAAPTPTATATATYPSMIRTPSTTTTDPTLGRNSSQKTDTGSNTGTMSWTGTGSLTLTNPGGGLVGLGKQRTKSSASTAQTAWTARTGGRVEEEELEGNFEQEGGEGGNNKEGVWWVKGEVGQQGGAGGTTEVKDRVEVFTAEARVGDGGMGGGLAGGRKRGGGERRVY